MRRVSITSSNKPYHAALSCRKGNVMAQNAAKQTAPASNDIEQVQRALAVTPAHSAQLYRHITGAFIELPAAFYATTPMPKTPSRKLMYRPSPILRAIAAKGA